MPIFDPEIFGGDTPDDEVRIKAQPGEYPFIVDEAVSRTRDKGNQYRSGNEGIALTLLVGALENRDLPVYVHLVNSPKAAWKIKEFCACVGVDPLAIESARELVNKAGKARFKNDEKGYLVAEKFLPVDAPEKKKEEKSGKLPF